MYGLQVTLQPEGGQEGTEAVAAGGNRGMLGVLAGHMTQHVTHQPGREREERQRESEKDRLLHIITLLLHYL